MYFKISSKKNPDG